MHETKHFRDNTTDKLGCPCCGCGGLSITVLIVLEDVRRHFNKPVKVTSGARCEAYNSEVGGMINSQHLFKEGVAPPAQAADIQVADTDPVEVQEYLESTPYSNLIGLGKYETFTHVDTRGWRARW